jgi:hypothetical protein
MGADSFVIPPQINTKRPPAGFVTLPDSGQEGARAEFDLRLGGRSLPVRYCFGFELS